MTSPHVYIRRSWKQSHVRFIDATSSGSGKKMYGERDKNTVTWSSGNRWYFPPLFYPPFVAAATAKSVSRASHVLCVVIVKGLIFWHFVRRWWNEQGWHIGSGATRRLMSANGWLLFFPSKLVGKLVFMGEVLIDFYYLSLTWQCELMMWLRKRDKAKTLGEPEALLLRKLDATHGGRRV